MTTTEAAPDHRVLFFPATAKDGSTTQAMLAPLGVRLDVCDSAENLIVGVRAGAGALLLAEECVSEGVDAGLRAVLATQPPWSDLPVLILTRAGADSIESEEAVQTLGNVTLLERPVRVTTLVSALRTALRARARQYQIREHLADRARAEESLRVADRRKDEFLATLGHELRNPLAPLLTAVELLRAARVTDPVATRVGTVVERQVTHLVRLVDDLLELSRITRGLVAVHREVTDLGSVIQSAIDTSRPALDAAGHHLIVEAPEVGLSVHGDTVRLTQVFANLLTNAAKYTNAGGLIRIRAEEEGNWAVVTVSDNGIGIAPDQLESVFDMFTQVDRSSRRAQGGLGIGLTLVRSLVAMHGGTVGARSEGLGRGSEFVVRLPLAADRPVIAQQARSIDRLPARRVLIVDDNHDAADTLADLLGGLGATVAVEYDGQGALASVESFKPDAVLLDIGMPGMDGYEVARRIRMGPDSADVLIVALTGWGQEHDQRRSRAAGFDHHVVKPLDLEKLRQLLSLSAKGRPLGRGGATAPAVEPPGRHDDRHA